MTIKSTALLTTAEAARFVQRKEATIRWWVRKGWLTAYETRGRTPYFTDADLIKADNMARRPDSRHPQRMTVEQARGVSFDFAS